MDARPALWEFCTGLTRRQGTESGGWRNSFTKMPLGGSGEVRDTLADPGVPLLSELPEVRYSRRSKNDSCGGSYQGGR